MPYCTTEEFVARIKADEAVQQSSWEPSSLFAEPAYISAHLEAASSAIDAALSVRYQTPIALTPTPPLLRQICLYMAWWYCELTGEIRQTVERHYEAAAAQLEQLRKGEINLVDSTGVVVPPINLGGESGSYTDRVQTFVGQRPGVHSFDRRVTRW